MISKPIRIKQVEDIRHWEDFWREAVNGTLFHSPKFLSYHAEGKFNNSHLEYYRKGNLCGVMASAIQLDGREKILVSYPGASYGGPAWSKKLQYHHLLDMVRATVEFAAENDFNVIRITPPPVIYNRQPEQALDFALTAHGFSSIRDELTQAVKLDFDPDKLLDLLVNKTRTSYRKAVASGLEFRIINSPTQEEFDIFWNILVENRAGLGVVPAHSKSEIQLLHELVPDNLMLAVIEEEGEIIAEIWNFVCNDYTMLEFYMAHIVEKQHLRPVPFLTYHTMLWAQARGYKWLDFGISSINGDPTWGLLKFKENFGCKHFLRRTWELRLS